VSVFTHKKMRGYFIKMSATADILRLQLNVYLYSYLLVEKDFKNISFRLFHG
jgi:hypothetical protein